jgi:HK97 family phage portal protein
MARRKRQHKPKGPGPAEQRSITANDQLVSLGGDATFLINSGGGVSVGGSGTLTAHSVAGYPPVSQCLQMIAGDCARLPLVVKRRDGLDALPVEAVHYAQRLIDPWGRPNDEDTQFDLFYDWYFDALLWGAGFLWIDRIGAMPVALYRLLPDRTWRIERGGRVYFVTHVYDDIAGQYVKKILPHEDVLYLEGTRIAEDCSSPIALYRNTFKAALNAQEFTVRYFDQGTQAGGILMVPPGAGETAINNTEKQVRARSDKENWFRTLVLKDGFRWQSTTSDLKSATTVELDEQSARAVARIFNIPPSKLGIRDSMSYNSRESDRQEYLDSCLSSWLIQGRSQVHRKLILPSEQPSVIVDYTVDELALLNLAARADWASKGLADKWLDPEEARRVMKLPPRPKQTKEVPATAVTGDVQATALNGAQIASLLEITNQVVAGALPKASANAMIRAAFPVMDQATINAIVEPLELKIVNGSPVLAGRN